MLVDHPVSPLRSMDQVCCAKLCLYGELAWLTEMDYYPSSVIQRNPSRCGLTRNHTRRAAAQGFGAAGASGRPPATQPAENSRGPSPTRSSIWPVLADPPPSPSLAAQTCCTTGTMPPRENLVLFKRRSLILDLVRLCHCPDFVRDRDRDRFRDRSRSDKGIDWMGGSKAGNEKFRQEGERRVHSLFLR
jgi:hypothetical protein